MTMTPPMLLSPQGSAAALTARKPVVLARQDAKATSKTGSSINNLPFSQRIYNRFDYDAIPSGKVANLSLQDMSTFAVVMAVYIPECIGAFASGRHPWETFGRNVLALVFRLGMTVFTKNKKFSLNSWFLDSAMHDKTQASLKKAKNFNEKLGNAWHNMVKVPIQKYYGINGDFINEAIRPSGIPVSERQRFSVNWSGFKGNELGSLKEMAERYELGNIKKLTQTHFKRVMAGEQTLDEARRLLFDPGQAIETNRGIIKESLNKDLIKTLSPKAILRESSKSHIRALFDRSGKIKPEADIQKGVTKFQRLWRLYADTPIATNKSLEQNFRAFLRDGKEAGSSKGATAALDRWLDELEHDWQVVHKKPVAQVLETLDASFSKLVARSKKLAPEALDAAFEKAWQPLAHISPNGKNLHKVGGKLASLLEPSLKLSQRLNVTRGFLDRQGLFMFAQLSFISVLNALLMGQLLMIIVFDTFARMDPDFVPPEKHSPPKDGHRGSRIGHWLVKNTPLNELPFHKPDANGVQVAATGSSSKTPAPAKPVAPTPESIQTRQFQDFWLALHSTMPMPEEIPIAMPSLPSKGKNTKANSIKGQDKNQAPTQSENASSQQAATMPLPLSVLAARPPQSMAARPISAPRTLPMPRSTSNSPWPQTQPFPPRNRPTFEAIALATQPIQGEQAHA